MHSGIDFLNSLTSKGIHPALDNVQAFYEKSGVAPNYFMVTVAGTNGKGSTVGYLSRVFAECDYRTGSILSPHIRRVNERILLDGREISDDDLDAVLIRVKNEVERTGISLTYFEALLFAALYYFEQEKVDAAVLEVGLGGRFDAVNVLNQDISIITSISFDHQHMLGNTLKDIASEKFAIVKEGNAVIANLSNPGLKEQLRAKCDKQKAELLLYGEDFSLQGGVYKCAHGNSLEGLEKESAGSKQWENIALVLTAFFQFLQRTGKKLEPERIKKAVREYLPCGRFEKVSDSPLVYLDVAHNEDSFAVLLRNVEETLQGRRKALLGAFSADKEWQPFIRKALEVFDVLLLCRYEYQRSETPENIRRFVETLGDTGKEVRYFQSVAEAKSVIQTLGDETATVVCGSFHTLDDYLAATPHSSPR